MRHLSLILCLLAGCAVAEAGEQRELCICEPRRVSDDGPPVPELGELMIWHNPVTGVVRLVYRDPVNGTVVVAMED
jgi:hypothetical protein